jgi:hypothetical protein
MWVRIWYKRISNNSTDHNGHQGHGHNHTHPITATSSASRVLVLAKTKTNRVQPNPGSAANRHVHGSAYCMRPPATRTDKTAEQATARADAAPVTGAGAGGTPRSVSCADVAANSTAATATATSCAAARDAIVGRSRRQHGPRERVVAAAAAKLKRVRG